eukprot:CAMPEP_0184371122 /NCGR_PEP_ID=MMETSP1089-20130417/163220_1 /TAXON_ID=38269 ORGANISM="Gloeochaete wittrockiana, Strain SAG46.84" /NCGR_SAMPLE_ID=MMETSP1089 /ASSEMBLY_ACC=CAM_ASM_000445 /LENGTH=94 /DNA_ID=CAMNT_0026713835 /DNA_START=1545 /DNA_END=1829 /DNA_ORIENTATION=+
MELGTVVYGHIAGIGNILDLHLFQSLASDERQGVETLALPELDRHKERILRESFIALLQFAAENANVFEGGADRLEPLESQALWFISEAHPFGN